MSAKLPPRNASAGPEADGQQKLREHWVPKPELGNQE